MKHKSRLPLTLLLILALLLMPPLASGEAPPERHPLELSLDWQQQLAAQPPFEPGRVLVQYAPDAAPKTREGALSGLAEAARDVTSDLTLINVPPGQELASAAQLRQQPGVLTATPNYRVQAFATPNDPYLSRQWHHAVTHAPDAWDLGIGNNTITVAVLDSGADLKHPDLAARLIAGHDYVDHDNEPKDAFGHGAHVAGLIGAVSNNFVGVAGVDWRARLLVIRVLDENGAGYLDDIVAGIDEAISKGARVINLSLGLYEAEAAAIFQPAINRAHAAGMVVVAAMGNDGTVATSYPAGCNYVIAVGSTTREDHYAYYSNWGSHLDLAAPGGETRATVIDGVYSTMPTYAVTANSVLGMATSYDYWQGTSMSAALVSGLSALLLSANPSLTPAQVESIMASTAQDLGPTGWDQDYGWGRIDLARAVGQIVPPAQVRDLTITAVTVTGASQRQVALRWTPSLHINSISIRRSTAPITAANWANATPVAVGLPPTTTSYTATSVPYSGGALYFALRADGQYAPGTLWSAVSNNAFWPVKRQVVLPISMKRR